MGHTLFLPLCGLSHLFLTQTSGIGTVLSHFIDEKTETIKITYLNQINEIQTQGSLTPGPMLNHHAVMPLGPGYILMPKKSLEHMYVYECFERLQNLVVSQNNQSGWWYKEKLKITLRLFVTEKGKDNAVLTSFRHWLLGKLRKIDCYMEGNEVMGG